MRASVNDNRSENPRDKQVDDFERMLNDSNLINTALSPVQTKHNNK